MSACAVSVSFGNVSVPPAGVRPSVLHYLRGQGHWGLERFLPYFILSCRWVPAVTKITLFRLEDSSHVPLSIWWCNIIRKLYWLWFQNDLKRTHFVALWTVQDRWLLCFARNSIAMKLSFEHVLAVALGSRKKFISGNTCEIQMNGS